MKQMGKAVRSGAWILCLLISLSIVWLPGCKKSPDQPLQSGETGTSPDTPETGGTSDSTFFPVELITEKKIKIVYPQGAEPALIDAAKNLRVAISTVFHTEIEFTSDYLRDASETFCEYEYEILVGETNRELDEPFRSLRTEDYCYCTSGKKIVLIGGSPNASAQAVTAFTYDIVLMKKGKGEIFYRSDWDKAAKADYTIEKLTLNGTDIVSYTIVYPKKGTCWEAGLAEHLAYRLEILTGHTITLTDDALPYSGGYEILIGKTNRTTVDAIAAYPVGLREGVFGAADKLAVLSGADSYGIRMAIEKFLDVCEKATDKTVRTATVTLGAAETVQPDPNILTMTFNLQSAKPSTARAERVFRMIKAYLPDVIGVQEATPDWSDRLKAKLGDYYEFVGELRMDPGSNERTSILVAKSRLNIIEYGTHWLNDTDTPGQKSIGAEYVRIFTYAKLHDAVTGSEWIHVNTHLDVAGETVRTYEARKILDFLHNGYEDLPVVLTGDLNARANSSTIGTLQKCGLKSASDMVTEKNAVAEIDWIFVTDDCVNVDFYHVCNERIQGDYPSDHFPVITKFSCFTPEGGISHDFGDVLPDVPDGNLQPKKDKDGEKLGPVHRIF